MDCRLQGLDPAVHDFGKAGEVGNLDHGDAGGAQRLGRSAGRQDLDPPPGEVAAELSSIPVLSDTETRARRMGVAEGGAEGGADGDADMGRVSPLTLRRDGSSVALL